jgi:hypothetical protein
LRHVVLRLAALIVFTLFAGQACADDWNVVRLRGTVLQLVDGDWQPLKRGDVVPDNRVLRTTLLGMATLTRGNETIELAPNTQIQIYDRGGKKPFTTVVEHFGSVAIEAEVQQVQHFAVQNQYLAAVVKGTRFTMSASRSGSAVEVQRGHVEVDSSTDDTTTLISVGQKAKVAREGPMTVSGKGTLPAVVKRSDKAAVKAAVEAVLAVEDVDAVKSDDNAGKGGDDHSKGHDNKSGKAPDNSGKSDDNAGKGGHDHSKGGDSSSGKGPDNSGKSDDDAGKGGDDHSGNGGGDNSGPGGGGDNPASDNSGKGHDDNSGKGHGKPN